MILNYLKEFWDTYSYLINLLGIVIPIPLAFFFDRRNKPLKLITFASRTFPVITDRSKKIDGLHITISGRSSHIVSVCRLVIWNAGNRTINSKDIPQSDPIRVYPCENVDVFYAKIIEQTHQANQIKLREVNRYPNSYQIEFDYLDPSDGALLDIVHSGDVLQEFKLTGSIKGGAIKKGSSRAEIVTTALPQAATLESDDMSGRESLKSTVFPFLIIISVLFGLIYFFTRNLGSLLAGFISISAGVIFYIWIRRRYPPPKIKNFDGTF
jgi:hypothetical protein